jgi:hypothetical protein
VSDAVIDASRAVADVERLVQASDDAREQLALFIERKRAVQHLRAECGDYGQALAMAQGLIIGLECQPLSDGTKETLATISTVLDATREWIEEDRQLKTNQGKYPPK